MSDPDRYKSRGRKERTPEQLNVLEMAREKARLVIAERTKIKREMTEPPPEPEETEPPTPPPELLMTRDPYNRHNFLFVDLNPKLDHPSPFRMNYDSWLIS